MRDSSESSTHITSVGVLEGLQIRPQKAGVANDPLAQWLSSAMVMVSVQLINPRSYGISLPRVVQRTVVPLQSADPYSGKGVQRSPTSVLIGK